VPVVLSALDQSPVSEGSTGADALRNSIDLARHAEQFGYERYWVAEHHGTPMLASAAPEILIAEIAAATSRIRAKRREITSARAAKSSCPSAPLIPTHSGSSSAVARPTLANCNGPG